MSGWRRAADGTSKPIEQIKTGEKIANALPGADPDTRDQAHTVTAVHITYIDHAYTDLTIATPTGPRTITGTNHHLYWDSTTRAWTRADHLLAGDHLQTSDGKKALIIASRSYTATMVTYNLTIDGLHTYYVEAGRTPVLVHNVGKGCLEGKRNHPVLDENGDIITDIDLFQDDILWEDKSIAGVGENQTVMDWVNDNVHTKFYKFLKARDYLPSFYEDAPIGFRFTASNINSELRSEIQDTVANLREVHPDVDIRLEWTR